MSKHTLTFFRLSASFIGSRIALLCFLMSVFSYSAFSQAPSIQSVSHDKASVNTLITINGSGFGTAATLDVWFGAVLGEITEANTNTIKVKVPPGATYSSIKIVNKQTGLSGSTATPFSPAFGGKDFSAANLTGPTQFSSNIGIYDLQLVDLDKDGLSEAVIANKSNTSISIYKNNSTLGNISYVKTDFSIGGYTETLTYGDLDGDGKSDLIFKGFGPSYNNKLYFVRNLSSQGAISLSAAVPFTLATTGDGQLALHDFDGDGKPEIVLSQSSNQVSIFKNQSSPGTISFSSDPVNIALPNGATAYGLALADLDNDKKTEIIVGTNFDRNVYILPNKSTESTIQFGSPLTINTPSGNLNLMVGDLDNDSRPDIALTNFNNVFLGIFLNATTSPGDIRFGSMTTFSTELRPWGLQMTDVDGDGLTDVLVAHSYTQDISVFKNYSTAGKVNFVQSIIPNLGKNYAVRGGDADGDGKPEILYTDFENNTLSVLRNTTCREARIEPEGSHTICSGTPFQLKTLQGTGLSYTWFKNGVEISGATNYALEVKESGNYTVALNESADGCSSTSPAVSVTVVDATMAAPEFYAITPVCQGGSLTLQAKPVTGASYIWSGPNGFSKTTTASTVTIENVSPAMAGTYRLTVNLGPCQAQELTQYAEVLQQPQPVIIPPTNTSVCANEPIQLSLQSSYTNYQWYKDGGAIAGANSATYAAQDQGTYTVVVTSSLGCTKTSEGITLNQGNTPVANFATPATACINQAVTFTNTTTATINQSLAYFWDFGDGSTSTQESPTHTYSSINGNPYTVSLKVRYSNASCEDIYTKTVTVIESASEEEVTIEAVDGTALCPGSSLSLQVTGEAAGVSWSNGQTGQSIVVTEAGNYTAQIQTTSGCILSRSIEIVSLPAPEIEISADKSLIRAGESVQLQASGGIYYEWSPAEGLDNPTIANPVARPLVTTTYTLTAFNEEGCSATDTITIEFDTRVDVSANKIFIPGQESYWKIEKIENYPNLSLHIINRFGKTIYNAQPYQNLWDGWYKGHILDEGIYYYVLKNERGEAVHTGSITLVH